MSFIMLCPMLNMSRVCHVWCFCCLGFVLSSVCLSRVCDSILSPPIPLNFCLPPYHCLSFFTSLFPFLPTPPCLSSLFSSFFSFFTSLPPSLYLTISSFFLLFLYLSIFISFPSWLYLSSSLPFIIPSFHFFLFILSQSLLVSHPR